MKERAAIAVVLALVVLAAAAWGLGWFAPERPEPDRGRRPVAGAAEGATGDPVKGEVGAPDGATPQADSGATARTAVATTPAAAGDGDAITVSGRLVDEDGRPQSGVGLRLEQEEPRGPGGLPTGVLGPGPDGEAPRTVTDGEGAFAFSARPGGPGRVRVEGQEHVLEAGAGRFAASLGDIELGELVVHRAASVAGVVCDDRGRRQEGIAVQLTTSGAAFWSRRNVDRTDERGRFRMGGLGPGEYVLHTASPRHLPAGRSLVLEAGEGREGIELCHRGGDGLGPGGGRPRPAGGRGAGGGGAGAARLRRRRRPCVRPPRGGDHGRRRPLPPGRARRRDGHLEASAEGRVSVQRRDVPVGTRDVVLRLQRTATVRGRVVDRAGGPVAGSRVRHRTGALRVVGPARSALVRCRREGDGSGRTELAAGGRVTVDGLAPGSYEVSARRIGPGHDEAPWSSPETVTLSAGKNPILTLTLLP